MGSSRKLKALPPLAAGECATVVDEHGGPWRACAAGDDAWPSSWRRSPSALTPRRDEESFGRAMLGVDRLGAAHDLARQSLRSAARSVRRSKSWLPSSVGRMRTLPRPGPQRAPLRPRRPRSRASNQPSKRWWPGSSKRSRASARTAGTWHTSSERRLPSICDRGLGKSLSALHEDARPAIARVLDDVARFGDVIDAILALSGPQNKRGEVILNVADIARELAPPGALLDVPDEALVEGSSSVSSASRSATSSKNARRVCAPWRERRCGFRASGRWFV